MKKLLLLVVVLTGCTRAADDSCMSVACANGRVYQQCVTPGSTKLHYIMGGESCSCMVATCTACTALVADYCQAVSAGGTSGDHPQPVCAVANQSCSGGCCSGLTCYHGVCGACTQGGGSCSSAAECCGGLACTSGVCGGPDAQCTALTQVQCYQCCENTHTDAARQFQQIALLCACQPTTCATACQASACNLTSPTFADSTCTSCYLATCAPQTTADCDNDALCRQYSNCLNACPM